MTEILGGNDKNKILGRERRCTATNRSGEQCKLAPIVGGFVCSLHGGKAPQVQQAARERLAALVDPSVDAFRRILASPDRCELCGRSADMAVVVRAATAVLDRTGYGPNSTVVVQARPAPRWVEYLTDDQLDQVGAWIEEAKARVVAGEPPPTAHPALPPPARDEDDDDVDMDRSV